jgi:MFS family permease
MLTGIASLVIGVMISLVSISEHSLVGFFAGTAVSGVGFGSGFQGGVRLVMPLAAPSQRAGTLALLFVVIYVGLGGPAVIAGYLVVHVGGLDATAREYGIAVIVLAIFALAGLIRTRSRGLKEALRAQNLHCA